MAKIMNVDYEAIPNQANQMRMYGKDLNSILTTTYQRISDMHNVWYGKRYNELVQDFNRMINSINDLLELVVGEIPFALENVANNYAQADKGAKVTSAQKTEPNKIVPINIINDIGMRFLTNEVNMVQQNVSSDFEKVCDKMNTIETEYGKIDWESEAADAFRSKFKQLKADIISQIQDINGQFKRLMAQTEDDIQNTENANTVQ